MSKHLIDLVGTVQIIVNDPEAVHRVTGSGGDEWRSMFYDLRTEDDVLEHWAYNALANNVGEASRLDGWADLPPEAVTMRVVGVNPT